MLPYQINPFTKLNLEKNKIMFLKLINIKRHQIKRTGYIMMVLIFISTIIPFWLFIIIFLVVLVYGITKRAICQIRSKKLQWIIDRAVFTTIIFFTVISVKMLAIEIYLIPSSSMENILYPGDVILVDKLTYGPGLPQNPFDIPWINLLFYINNSARTRMDEDWWPYKRLSGFGKLNRGDVLVCKQARKAIIAKRCIALPGDLFRLKKGEVYINENHFSSPLTVKESYRLNVADISKFKNSLDSLGVNTTLHRDTKNNFVKGKLSKYEIAKLLKLNILISAEKEKDTFGINKALFANPENEKWTFDEMGPFNVPKKGMTIPINNRTYVIYGKTIEQYEEYGLKEKKKVYYDSSGNVVRKYTFKQDYCFLLGDNRKASADSRTFGFVPRNQIIGKVQCVLFSSDNGRFRWERLLKIL